MISVLDVAEQEMRTHGAARLKKIRVRHGILANVVPEAMHMAFTALTAEGPHQGAILDLEEEALELRCRACGHICSSRSREALFLPCPACGAIHGYDVERGEGIFLDHLEAE